MTNNKPNDFFDGHMMKLAKPGDLLQKLDKIVDWNVFEPSLSQAFGSSSMDGGLPFSKLMLFKALIIQSLYDLPDEQLEYQILDRTSFQNFLGLKEGDEIPDSRTFLLFREYLIGKGVIAGLYKTFNTLLDDAGLIVEGGKLTDASFEEVPGRFKNPGKSGI